ncbi:hypothetical protein [Abiotrophia sp.]|uniref:HNH endonuclease n=1 Tax=Abiotrophia sp. TaxID=76631 RepID=UPI001CAE4E58|nr:hypothetical protein [Abiotrophia sp.]MBF0937684.1 hypothetical protein [Abiotrophia sp.]
MEIEMRQINQPTFKVDEIAEDIKNKSRLYYWNSISDYENWKNELINAESEYFANYRRLYTLGQQASVNGIEKSRMADIYDNYYKKDSKWRSALYNLNSVGCPICDTEWGYSEKTLDHILPKSLYPQFAITPINLVTTCSQCNHTKLDKVGKNENQGVINPYFHFVNIPNLTKCEIEFNDSDYTVIFKLKPLEETELDIETYNRLKYFLKIYGLEQKYTTIIMSKINSMCEDIARVVKTEQIFVEDDFLIEELLYDRVRSNNQETYYNISDITFSNRVFEYFMYSALNIAFEQVKGVLCNQIRNFYNNECTTNTQCNI